MSRNARRLVPLCAWLVVGGCAVVAPVGEAPPGGVITECDGAQLAFAGEATLAEVGLADFIGPEEAGRRGFIQITAGPIVPEGMQGGRVGLEPARWVCVQWPDGGGMGGTIPDDWQLPEVVQAAPVADEAAEDGLPVLPIALVALVAAAVGITVIAFRGERSS